MAKILTTEEKARRYDEIIEKLRSLHDDYDTVSALIDIKEELENILPELKESEGEKVKKAIFGMVYDSDDELWGSYDVSKSDVLAWLEKQGEKKSIDDLTPQEVMDIAIAKCFEQGEQKPANKVEPKFKVKYAGSEYNVLKVKDIAGVTFYGIEDEPNHIDYVKAENCEIISVQKQRKENSMTDEQKKEVKTMYNDGWNPEDISEELGYDETEVMEYCAEIL